MYTNLEAFQKADYHDKVTNLSKLTHQLQCVKSPVEVRLMRESASIARQVNFQASVVAFDSYKTSCPEYSYFLFFVLSFLYLSSNDC